MTETDQIEQLRQQMESIIPQIAAFGQAVEPLIEMFQTYLSQIGVTMRVGTIYLRSRGKLIHGIIFEGDQQALEKLLIMMGGEQKDAGTGEEKET